MSEQRDGRWGSPPSLSNRSAGCASCRRATPPGTRSAPATAAYLGALLGAFDAEPLAGESFAFFLQSDLEDPTTRFERLAVVGRRLLPTRLLRSAAMTVDPFLLRGAALGAAWRAERGGAGGAVYHAAGGSALPLASGLPVVVTLLDLAPWELAGAFQRTPATRFGQRSRAASCVTPTRSSSAAMPSARRPAPAASPPRPDPGHSPATATFTSRVRMAPRSGAGSACPSATSSTPGGTDAARTLATLLRAGRAGAAGAGRRPPRGGSVAAAHPARGAKSRRPCGARPGGGARTRRRRAGLRATCPMPGSRPSCGARGPRSSPCSEAAGFAAIDALACRTPIVVGVGASRSSSGRPASSSRRASRDGSQRCRRPGPTGGARADRRRGAARAAERRTGPRSPPRPGGSTRRSAPTLTRCRRRSGAAGVIAGGLALLDGDLRADVEDLDEGLPTVSVTRSPLAS